MDFQRAYKADKRARKVIYAGGAAALGYAARGIYIAGKGIVKGAKAIEYFRQSQKAWRKARDYSKRKKAPRIQDAPLPTYNRRYLKDVPHKNMDDEFKTPQKRKPYRSSSRRVRARTQPLYDRPFEFDPAGNDIRMYPARRYFPHKKMPRRRRRAYKRRRRRTRGRRKRYRGRSGVNAMILDSLAPIRTFKTQSTAFISSSANVQAWSTPDNTANRNCYPYTNTLTNVMHYIATQSTASNFDDTNSKRLMQEYLRCNYRFVNTGNNNCKLWVYVLRHLEANDSLPEVAIDAILADTDAFPTTLNALSVTKAITKEDLQFNLKMVPGFFKKWKLVKRRYVNLGPSEAMNMKLLFGKRILNSQNFNVGEIYSRGSYTILVRLQGTQEGVTTSGATSIGRAGVNMHSQCEFAVRPLPNSQHPTQQHGFVENIPSGEANTFAYVNDSVQVVSFP